MIADRDHSYYCSYCRTLIEAETLHRLCTVLNDHNYLNHPGEHMFSPSGLSCSMHYAGPNSVRAGDDRLGLALSPPDPTFGAQSCSAWTPAWGDAKPPNITSEDIEMLKKALVKW